MFVATGVVAGVCAWIYTSLFLLTGHRQGMYWRKMYLEAVLRQDVAWFDVHNPTELPTKIAEKTAAVQQGLGLKLGEGIFFGVQMFGGVGYAFWMDWKVSLVSLITAPLVGWGLYFLTKVTGEADAIMNKAYAKAGGCASETIENIKTVNALQCEDARIEEYDTHLVEARDAGEARSKTSDMLECRMLVSLDTGALPRHVGRRSPRVNPPPFDERVQTWHHRSVRLNT
mmetsp:Transcript_45419/g.125288  ORF Transcript_45419/g.125288 Transcript_45419/m.125288 type:complete len:228 (+) Transcript_45419:617-1300(+)